MAYSHGCNMINPRLGDLNPLVTCYSSLAIFSDSQHSSAQTLSWFWSTFVFYFIFFSRNYYCLQDIPGCSTTASAFKSNDETLRTQEFGCKMKKKKLGAYRDRKTLHWLPLWVEQEKLLNRQKCIFFFHRHWNHMLCNTGQEKTIVDCNILYYIMHIIIITCFSFITIVRNYY